MRSWTTFPFDVQIIRINLAQGEHNFLMNYVGGANANIKVNIKGNEKVILRVLRTGSQLRVMTLYPADIQPVQPPAISPSINK